MKRLLLLGGGHSHVFVLDALARQPLDGVEVVLLTPYRRQVYSGMLPGWIAGHYSLDACMIPLDTLAARSDCRFLHTSGTHIDADKREVVCADGLALAYDVLSVDVGSTTDVSALVGAEQHALPVRPIERFIAGWERILEQARERTGIRLAILGGGAAGAELALSMAFRLNQETGGRGLSLHLVSASPNLLPDHPRGVGKRLERILRRRQIAIHAGNRALSVSAEGIRLANGETIPVTQTILATGASAPPWLKDTSIALDAEGFIGVDRHLRSLSHPDIFAAGDVASMAGHPRPKSGVYAVRAGPPLAENLRRALSGHALLSHTPQQQALYLMCTGGQHAVASWGPFSWAGNWVWQWKDHIDRKFVARYQFNETQP